MCIQGVTLKLSVNDQKHTDTAHVVEVEWVSISRVIAQFDMLTLIGLTLMLVQKNLFALIQIQDSAFLNCFCQIESL